MSKRDFLVEIGSEEMPPKSLFTMAAAFAGGIARELNGASIPYRAIEWFATPRRLAVRVTALADRQPDQEIKRQGPAVAHAFDANGHPTKAASGFAASCGTTVEALQQVDGPKGKVLQYVGTRAGAETSTLLGSIVNNALRTLPIARRMRWGAGAEEFVRPVHWVVMLFGSSVVDASVLGIQAGKATRGHRFHAPRELVLRSPKAYTAALLEKGYVVADVNERRERIRSGVTEVAHALGGTAVINADLLDEVTSLVEWPVPLAGRFDAQYLELPSEVLVATMQDHQRYFPVRDAAGKLMNHFITVANIQSRDPDKVRDGNERVVRPRLADAAFFWAQDRKLSLASRSEGLKAVTFQSQLGSQFDRSERIRALAARIAASIGADIALTERAASLCKADLLTAMVGEFPELQGVMGKYYAQLDGEASEVSAALEQHYLPRFAGDALPSTPVGRALALADKLDLLAGIFAIGQKPTGTRDPYALRRAAIGALRICTEAKLDLDLREVVREAVRLQPASAAQAVEEDVWSFLIERLRGSYLETSTGVSTEMFDAVLASGTASPIDIDARLTALTAFLALPASSSLASANKRIANILRKAEFDSSDHEVNGANLTDPAEQQLFEHYSRIQPAVSHAFNERKYEEALTMLAALREDVDRFFDQVMVMAEDPAVRANRLALLAKLRGLFLRGVDLSKLPG